MYTYNSINIVLYYQTHINTCPPTLPRNPYTWHTFSLQLPLLSHCRLPQRFEHPQHDLNMSPSYLLWKKSCTSWYGKYPIIYMALYILGCAGFLPSTVWMDVQLLWLVNLPPSNTYPPTKIDGFFLVPSKLRFGMTAEVQKQGLNRPLDLSSDNIPISKMNIFETNLGKVCLGFLGKLTTFSELHEQKQAKLKGLNKGLPTICQETKFLHTIGYCIVSPQYLFVTPFNKKCPKIPATSIDQLILRTHIS